MTPCVARLLGVWWDGQARNLTPSGQNSESDECATQPAEQVIWLFSPQPLTAG